MADTTFTGIERRRTTPRRVRVAEIVSRAFITMGGLGTIVAVVLIFAFLLWVVVPLFEDAHASKLPFVAVENEVAPIIATGVDDGQLMAWTLRSNGVLVVRRLSDGTELQRRSLFGQGQPTSWSFSTYDSEATGWDPENQVPTCAFGFADGTLRKGIIRFRTEFLKPDAVSDEARTLRPGGSTRHESGMVQMTSQLQLRYDFLGVWIDEPVKIANGAIEMLDYSVTPGGTAYGFYSADGKLSISSIDKRHNFLTDTMEYETVEKPLEYDPPEGRGAPAFLKLSGIGNTLFLIWRDGLMLRFDARDEVLADARDLEVVEDVLLFGENGDRVVDRVQFLVGKSTLMVADEQGELSAWFATRPSGAYPRDGIVMAAGHTLRAHDAFPLRTTFMAPSRRSRMLGVGYEDGSVRLYHVTTKQELLAVATDKAEPVLGLAMAPKEDGLIAWTRSGMQRWHVDPGHPEATWGSLFTPVWYEGNVDAEHDWEAEGGSDDFEPKLGLVKLVFGTLKATLYAMLIAAPIALLGAIFTSEFLEPRLRAPIKSVIEMMASLPSVVLGFLAAIVLAPFVEDVLVTVLCCFLTVPLTIVLGARLWQFLPTRIAIRLSGLPRFFAIAATLPLGLWFASLVAPAAEGAFFAGDVMAWLSGERGSSSGGWTFLFIPFGLCATGFAVARFAGPWLRRVSLSWSRAQCALIDVARFAFVLVGGVLVAWLLGQALGGTDPRGGVVGKYEPRNAMIVGFVMGFAIVPIIYTLAEDALSSVPNQLREGSLGCGATPWQTALRIVVPTATSGIFSALMIGLGRAVGETMIVLMAAGNTAILDLNIFNGFRTLSANIAVELPEAVKDSTHYRILFLSGLVLFAMTFGINTVAEIVRRRFRKRFADL